MFPVTIPSSMRSRLECATICLRCPTSYPPPGPPFLRSISGVRTPAIDAAFAPNADAYCGEDDGCGVDDQEGKLADVEDGVEAGDEASDGLDRF